MAEPTTDKPSNITALHDNRLSAVVRSTKPAPTFTFGHDEDSSPELEILGAGAKAASQIAATQGVDLTGKKKIIFWIGRGKTGKTTGIRWSAEAAILAGHTLLMADMDPTNDTFSKYIDDVARPPEASDPAMSLKWLDKLLQHALHHGLSLLVDLAAATPRSAAW